MVDLRVFDNDEANELFEFLDTLDVEYRKPYMRFGKTAHVPRGQASFTFSPDIHYDYKVSGGSPPNLVMCDKLKEITTRVNKVLNTNFNTILLNKYKDGNDCIGFHQDRENGWAPSSGFATLSWLLDCTLYLQPALLRLDCLETAGLCWKLLPHCYHYFCKHYLI